MSRSRRTTKDNEKSESLKMVELKSIEYDKNGTEYEREEQEIKQKVRKGTQRAKKEEKD